MIFFFLSPSSFIPPYLRRISPYILFPRTWHHSVPIFLFCCSSKRLGSSNQILASKSTANEFIYIYIYIHIHEWNKSWTKILTRQKQGILGRISLSLWKAYCTGKMRRTVEKNGRSIASYDLAERTASALSMLLLRSLVIYTGGKNLFCRREKRC